MNDLLFDLRPSPTSFDLVSLKKVLLCVFSPMKSIVCLHLLHTNHIVQFEFSKKMAGHKSCCILSFICLFADPGHRRPYLGRSNNENGLSASPVQQQLTKAFFFYLIQIKGRRDKSFKLRFNFYHLHATISTRLFFSLTKLLMMISYLITFPFFRKCAGNYFRWCTAVWEQHTMPMRRCL